MKPAIIVTVTTASICTVITDRHKHTIDDITDCHSALTHLNRTFNVSRLIPSDASLSHLSMEESEINV
jgi:hypothetical protein